VGQISSFYSKLKAKITLFQSKTIVVINDFVVSVPNHNLDFQRHLPWDLFVFGEFS